MRPRRSWRCELRNEPGHKLVIRYLDGRMEKCTVKRQVAVTPTVFRLIDERNHVRAVALADLKAVFFVRDFTGDARYQERKKLGKDSPRVGYVVTVTFKDGEVLVGRSMNPSFGDHGFFLEPADPKSNNSRIFVVRASVAKVEVASA